MSNSCRLMAIASLVMLGNVLAYATSNHEYFSDEYDTITNGISPNGRYAITAHGSSNNLGYTGFHIYLTDAKTGKKIGPLEEISDNLDTGSDAFAAKWSADSKSVYVAYRISRHEPLQVVSYRIDGNRAFPVTKRHVDASDDQISYWQKAGSGISKSSKIFGRPNLNQYIETKIVPGMY